MPGAPYEPFGFSGMGGGGRAPASTRGPRATKALEGSAMTKKQRELEEKKERIRGVQERRQLQPGKNFQPLINPTEEELGALRLQHGGHGSNLSPRELEAQLKETYVDPNIRANIPEPQPRTREQRALPRTVTPVQSPRIYELLINAKAAAALGLEIPEVLGARADQIIE